VLGQESISAAAKTPAEMAEEDLTAEFFTAEESAELDRLTNEHSAKAWREYFNRNNVQRVQPLVARYLADRGLALPEHPHLHRTVLHMALRVVAKAKEIVENDGDPDAFPYADRQTPMRVAAILTDDLRLATLEEAFTAHTERKKARGG